MRGLIGYVEQPRCAGLAHLGEEIERVVGECVGGEEFAGRILALRLSRGQADHHARLPRVHRVAAHEAVEVIEAAYRRRHAVAHVPFADGGGMIAGGLEHLRDGDATGVERAAIAGEGFALVARAGETRAAIGGHEADAGLVRIQAGEQRSARRTTPRAVVELREAQPIGGERIEIRCADFTAVTSQVREAHVVGEDDEDVGFRARCGGDRRFQGEQSEAGQRDCEINHGKESWPLRKSHKSHE